MKRFITVAVVGLVALACLVRPAAGSTTNDATTGGPSFNSSDAGKVYVAEKTVNFATYSCASGDCVQVFYMPSNALITAVQWNVLTTNTPTSGLQTFTVGLGSSVTLGSGSMAAVGTFVSPLTTGVLCTANSYIRITPTDACDDGSIRLRVQASDFSQ